MKTYMDYARQYAANHQRPMTKYLDAVAVVLLYFAIMIFFSLFYFGMVHVFELHFSWIATLVLIVFYFYLNWLLALPMLPVLMFFTWLADMAGGATANDTSVWLLFVCLILGLILKIVAFYMERGEQSLREMFLALPVAPLCLLSEVFVAFNLMPPVTEKTEASARRKTK